MPKPSLFIGSSREGLSVAQALQTALQDVAEVTIWNQGFFGLTHGTLETLVNALERFDFAVLVATPDDLVIHGDEPALGPRDNILFELGLFMGRLGRSRTFVLADPEVVRLPTDLAGVTIAKYDSKRRDGNLVAAVGPAAFSVTNVVRDLGELPEREAARFERATEEVRGISTTMERLIHLLARSRAVELKVISQQFGAFINTENLRQMVQDLEDLQRSTEQPPG
ncbi:MAG TPA: nucleotide-binding protein [Longimicrobium sp.]|jgi:hypothetical protein